MKLIRRIKTTFFGAIDTVVGSLENHEAILESSLKTARINLGKAKARLNLVSSERLKLEDSAKNDEAEAALWIERAKTTVDREKALECLKRHEQLKRKAKVSMELAGQQKLLEEGLSKEIYQVEERLKILEQKKNVYKVRAAKAEVLLDPGLNLDEIFNRWDETLTCIDTAQDTFAYEFESKEENERLNLLLDSIRQN
jgi:phage shock protein A